jgi:hypothetical protein
MFKKASPKGIEGDKGGPGVKASIPVEPAKKPKKKKKGKPKKTSVAKEGQKGKIAQMLSGKYCSKDLSFSGKGAKANQFDGSKSGQAVQFVPEQKRMGIKG